MVRRVYGISVNAFFHQSFYCIHKALCSLIMDKSLTKIESCPGPVKITNMGVASEESSKTLLTEFPTAA